MFFAGLSNTEIVYESLNKNLQEGQVTGCVLDGLIFENKVWKESSFNNTNANNVLVKNSGKKRPKSKPRSTKYY